MFGGTMALPQLTDEQRKAALEKAAAARHARAELRDKIKKGEISLEEVLDSDDPIAARMKVSALIESLPGYGKAKAAKIMNELGISPSRRVKGLGARQREQLLEALSKEWDASLESSSSRDRQVWERARWSRVCATGDPILAWRFPLPRDSRERAKWTASPITS